MTIALSATGHGAMECTITNACERGETILIACNGIWGDRATDMAKRAGAGSPDHLQTVHFRSMGCTMIPE